MIQPIDVLKVKQERALDYEAGVKTTLFDNRLVLDADLFWTEVKDYQANTTVAGPSGTFLSLITNVGGLRSRRAELEVTATPFAGLKLNGSVAYDDATYGESPPAAPAVQGSAAPTQNLSGRPVVQAPKWTANIGGVYTHGVGGGYDGFLGADYAWKSGFYGYVDNSPYSSQAMGWPTSASA